MHTGGHPASDICFGCLLVGRAVFGRYRPGFALRCICVRCHIGYDGGKAQRDDPGETVDGFAANYRPVWPLFQSVCHDRSTGKSDGRAA